MTDQQQYTTVSNRDELCGMMPDGKPIPVLLIFDRMKIETLLVREGDNVFIQGNGNRRGMEIRRSDFAPDGNLMSVRLVTTD